MSTLTIEIADDLALRLEKVSAARHVKPSQVISESLAKTLPAPAALETLHDPVGCFDSGASDSERRAWSAASKRAMSRVFGDDEPEYSAADAIP